MKIYICFALLIFMVTPSLAEVYKCKVNGKLVYSQISCADGAVKMNIIRYTPPTAEYKYKQELAAQQGEIDKQKQLYVQQNQQYEQRKYDQNQLYEQSKYDQNQQYEQRKYDLIDQINNVNLGFDQSITDLRNAKAHRQNLQNELKMLEREHLATIDPGGSSARLLEDSVDELKEEVSESARKSRGRVRV